MTPETTSSRPRWVKPSLTDEISELERVSSDEGIDLEALKMAFAASKPVILTDSDWARLENTDSYNTENLTQASKAASSYGRDIDSVMKGFQTGNSMKMPVVLERPDNTITLVGGNTRLMAARVLGIQPTVLWISSSNFSEPVNSMDTTSSRVATESHHSPREGDDVSVSHIESKFRLEGVLGDISGPASLSGIATMFEGGEILFEPDDGSEIDDNVYEVITDIIGESIEFPSNTIGKSPNIMNTASRVAAKYLSRTADSSNIVSQVDDILNGETNGPHGHDDVKYDEDIIKWCKEARKTVPKMQKIFDDAFHDVMDFKSEIPDSKNPKIRQLAHGKFSEMLSQAGARVEIISQGLLQEIEALCNGLESGASKKKKASMKPSQLASQLRRIAAAIDNSKNPDRTLVAKDLKKVLAAVSSGTGALRAIIENEEIVGIEADFNGKKYVLDYPCDDDGDDRELDDATAFKMVETTYKGQDDQEVDDIISLGAHPKAMNADYEDNDGDYIYKVWFFLSDVDNVDEVNVLKTMIS